MIKGWLDLLFNALYSERESERERERERERGEFLQGFHGHLELCSFSSYLWTLFSDLFTKILTTMSVSTNVFKPLVCDPLKSIYLTS